MATSRGNQLAQEIRQKVEALNHVCQGVDKNLASRTPADGSSLTACVGSMNSGSPIPPPLR